MSGLPSRPLHSNTRQKQRRQPPRLGLLLRCVLGFCVSALSPCGAAADWLAPKPTLTCVPVPADAIQTEVVRLGDTKLLNAMLPYWKAAPLIHRDTDPAASAILPADLTPHCLSAEGWAHPDCVSSDAWVTTSACHLRVGDTIWGLLDSAVESGGHNLTLLLSTDAGRTWLQHATIPKPHYTARCVSLSASSTLTAMRLVIEQGDCADCGAALGLYTFTSDDLGRTWHLVSSP